MIATAPRAVHTARATISRAVMRLIGMVHLPPLPGSPRWDGSMEHAIAVALADASALIDNGMDALIIENYGDAPFTAGRVSAATVAAMAVIAHEIRRALADGLVVSGRATGDATPIEDVKRVRSAVPDVPILVGSGVTPETAPELLSLADALIVGTSLKRDGDVSGPVDPARVRRLVDAVGGR